MTARTLLFGLALLSLTTACGAGAQKPAIDTVLDNPQMRRGSFEATLRVLDENPRYVDEFFAQALHHPSTLDRFLRNTAREVERDAFARFVAKRLVLRPSGLKRIMIATLDEVSDDPAGLQAVSEAMAERPQVAAIVIVQSEDSIRKNVRALLVEVGKNPAARRAYLIAMSENAPMLAELIAPNPEVIRSLLAAFGRVGLNKGEKEIKALVNALE